MRCRIMRKVAAKEKYKLQASAMAHFLDIHKGPNLPEGRMSEKSHCTPVVPEENRMLVTSYASAM